MGDLPLVWWVLFYSLPPVPAAPVRQAEGPAHGCCGQVPGAGVRAGADVDGGADVAVVRRYNILTSKRFFLENPGSV